MNVRQFIFFLCLFSVFQSFAQQNSGQNLKLDANKTGELEFSYVKYNSYLLKLYRGQKNYRFHKYADTADRFIFLPIASNSEAETTIGKVLPVLVRKTKNGIILHPDLNRNLNFDDEGLEHFTMNFTEQNKLFSFMDGDKDFNIIIDMAKPVVSNKNSNRILPKELKISGFEEDGSTIGVRFNNVRYATFQDKFIIGVYDANFDGTYNQSEKDRYFVASLKDSKLNYEESFPVDQGFLDNLILLDSIYYKIDSISKNGKSIYIQAHKPPIDNKIFVPSVLPKKIPQLNFYGVNGGTLSINSFIKKGKYVLLERWGTWCVGCIQQQPVVRDIYNKYNSKLTLISLDGGDKDIQKVKEYISENKMVWLNGFENQEIQNNLFRTMGYPCAVLLDGDGQIVMKTSRFADIKEYLEKEIKK